MMGGAGNQDNMDLEYWREQSKTMDNGRVNKGILITKPSNDVDKREVRAPNTSESNSTQ